MDTITVSYKKLCAAILTQVVKDWRRRKITHDAEGNTITTYPYRSNIVMCLKTGALDIYIDVIFGEDFTADDFYRKMIEVKDNVHYTQQYITTV